MLRDSVAVISSSHAAAVCAVLLHLVLRAVIEPPLMGIWTTMRRVLEYAGYSSLGINRAAARDIAVAAGRRDGQSQRQVADVAMTAEVVSAAFVALVLLGAGTLQFYRGSVQWAVALWVAAWIAVAGRYQAFCLTVLRSEKQFSVLARARVFGAIADMLLLGGGAYCLASHDTTAPFYGMMGGAAVAHLLNACYVRIAGRLRFAAECDRGLASRLLVDGWPMAAEALALAALRSIDQLAIVGFLPDGAQQLGWYSIAVVLSAWAFDQSNLLANVVYPRLGETLGRTGNPAAVLRLGLRSAELIALAMVPCAALLLAAGVPAVHWLLPKYRPGLGAVGGLVAAAALMGISMPLRYALITVGRAVWMLLATALAAGASLAGSVWLLNRGGGLNGVSWNSAAAAAICLSLLILLCLAACGDLWPLAVRVAGAAVYGLLGTAKFTYLQDATWPQWALLVAWCLGPIGLLARRIEWKQSLPGRPAVGSS
ncbi:MAG: oligosaccharide flippase family protein [Planctomycetes bacterium]|nr:oligosaccharide flippase family protein [Planctomycetota bacterium]